MFITTLIWSSLSISTYTLMLTVIIIIIVIRYIYMSLVIAKLKWNRLELKRNKQPNRNNIVLETIFRLNNHNNNHTPTSNSLSFSPSSTMLVWMKPNPIIGLSKNKWRIKKSNRLQGWYIDVLCVFIFLLKRSVRESFDLSCRPIYINNHSINDDLHYSIDSSIARSPKSHLWPNTVFYTWSQNTYTIRTSL